MNVETFTKARDFAKSNPDLPESKAFAEKVFRGEYNDIISQDISLTKQYRDKIPTLGDILKENKPGTFLGRAFDRITSSVKDTAKRGLELEKETGQTRLETVGQATASLIGETGAGTLLQVADEVDDLITNGNVSEAINKAVTAVFDNPNIEQFAENNPRAFANIMAGLDLAELPILKGASGVLDDAVTKSLKSKAGRAKQYVEKKLTKKGGIDKTVDEGVTFESSNVDTVKETPINERATQPSQPKQPPQPVQTPQPLQTTKALEPVQNAIAGVSEIGKSAVESARRAVARIPENIKAIRETRAEFQSLPIQAQEAVRLGGDFLPQRDVKRIVNSTPKQKEEFIKLKQVADEFDKTGRGATPQQVLGQKIVDRVQALASESKKTGEELGKIADNLNTPIVASVDAKTASRRIGDVVTTKQITNAILDRLAEMPAFRGVKVLNNGTISFKGTRVASELSDDVRKKLGGYIKPIIKMQDVGDLHSYRQELFDKIKPQLIKGDLRGAEQEAIEAIRKGLTDVIEQTSDDYRRLNQRYAALQNADLELNKKFKIEGLDQDIASDKAGTILRRLTSNATSKGDIQQALKNLQDTFDDLGIGVEDIDFETMQEFINTLNRIYDIEGDTSLANIMRDVPLRQAASGQGIIGSIVDTFGKAIPTQSSVENARKGLDILLNSIKQLPSGQ